MIVAVIDKPPDRGVQWCDYLSSIPLTSCKTVTMQTAKMITSYYQKRQQCWLLHLLQQLLKKRWQSSRQSRSQIERQWPRRRRRRSQFWWQSTILMINNIDNYVVTTTVNKRWQPVVKNSHQLADVTIPTPKWFMIVGTSIPGCPRLRLGIVNGKKCLERGLEWLKKFWNLGKR